MQIQADLSLKLSPFEIIRKYMECSVCFHSCKKLKSSRQYFTCSDQGKHFFPAVKGKINVWTNFKTKSNNGNLFFGFLKYSCFFFILISVCLSFFIVFLTCITTLCIVAQAILFWETCIMRWSFSDLTFTQKQIKNPPRLSKCQAGYF